MLGKVITLGIGCVLAIALPAPLFADEPITAAPASWQTDYGKFVEAVRACMQRADCDVANTFSRKSVSWEGTVSRISIGQKLATLQMLPQRPTVADDKGVMRTLVFSSMSLADLAEWSNLTEGQKVPFQAVIEYPGVKLIGAPGEEEATPPPHVVPVAGPLALVRLTEARVQPAN